MPTVWEDTAYCYTHAQQFPLSAPAMPQQYRWSIAGTTCTDHSSMSAAIARSTYKLQDDFKCLSWLLRPATMQVDAFSVAPESEVEEARKAFSWQSARSFWRKGRVSSAT